jgi:MFS family permease
MTRISDRTGRRVLIAALGLLISGSVMTMLPLVDSGYGKLALIIVALGYYASSYSPNIWSILQASVRPEAVGAASGLINGVGAGAATLAGFLVALLNSQTGSYMSGFIVLGLLVILGGISLLAFGHFRSTGTDQSQPAVGRQ